MDYRFKLRKEFFGGIIYDSKSKKNISIDQDLYFLLESLITNKKIPIQIDSEELIDLLHQLSSSGIIQLNLNLLETNDDYIDHLTAPFRIFYDITYACNLRCKHCFTNSGAKLDAELTLNEKLRLISEIKKIGTNRLSIAGGEPFICPDLFPFLKACKETGIDVSITTNGTLFNSDIIAQLRECELKNLTISFDGATRESVDSIRGAGTYDMAINGLSLLQKSYHRNYSIKTTLMKNNINEIEGIIDIAIMYGCDTIKFNCVRDDGRASTNRNMIILSDSEYINVVKHIENLKAKYEGQIHIRAPLNVFCDDAYDYIEDLGFGCFAGKESICINPTGDVKPCSHFPKDFICGNIKQDSLFDIWHKSNVLHLFRHLSGNTICNNCEQYDMCRAGCRFRAYKAGDINGVDPYCYISQATP